LARTDGEDLIVGFLYFACSFLNAAPDCFFPANPENLLELVFLAEELPVAPGFAYPPELFVLVEGFAVLPVFGLV